jgi:hypothetical protein
LAPQVSQPLPRVAPPPPGGGGGGLTWIPLRTNKLHIFLSWQLYQILSYKTYELHPPVAALDIKIDLAGQLTRQLVAVLHEVSQNHVTDPVPARKYKINVITRNTAQANYATDRSSRACQLSNPKFYPTWRAVCMESFLSTGWREMIFNVEKKTRAWLHCVDRLGGLTEGGKDLGGQVFLPFHQFSEIHPRPRPIPLNNSTMYCTSLFSPQIFQPS